MKNPNNKFIHVTWSGGIDSTALIGLLLKAGWSVQPVTLLFGKTGYKVREEAARDYLLDWFLRHYPESMQPSIYVDGNFLSEFAIGPEIPRRNKHILDFMMMQYVIPQDGYYLGMGEYIGADTWLVKDHVGAHDADSRYLAAYMLHEYGLDYRFMALNDFGESRYKADRIRLLVDALSPYAALRTSNCMDDLPGMHCGKCYKCIERHVGFEEVLGRGHDTTQYDIDPEKHVSYELYLQQMRGDLVDLSWEKANA